MSNIYVLLSNGGFIRANEIFHHGVEGMHWGVRRYQNEDGALTDVGRQRLRGYDNDDDDFNYVEQFGNAERYVKSWERNYGSTPINRLRFEYNGDDVVNRGNDYCSSYDWNRTSLDNIYDAYEDYRNSRDWD